MYNAFGKFLGSLVFKQHSEDMIPLTMMSIVLILFVFGMVFVRGLLFRLGNNSLFAYAFFRASLISRSLTLSSFNNATLLIDGGIGSFGHIVLKHFLYSDIGEIRIFSRDEKKQDNMCHEL